jgi:ribokinase
MLLRRGPRALIVTLGDRGALLVGEGAAEIFRARAVQAVDSAGAGDAFIGSLAVFRAEGQPLANAVRQANAVAALSVTRLGTQASFPSRLEVSAALVSDLLT